MKYSYFKKIISPKVGTGLAGYVRKHTSKGIFDDLYLQMLLLEDKKKNQLLLISAELIGFEEDFVKKFRTWVQRKNPKLKAAHIMFNATHTHCGPCTSRFTDEVGRIDNEYLSFLESSLKEGYQSLVSLPLKSGKLKYGKSCRFHFAMNRRKKVQEKVNGKSQDMISLAPNPKGPIDPELNLIIISSKSEELFIANYGCHPTTRGGYHISGDFPGAAAREIRSSSYKKREFIFLQGAAGDNRVPVMDEEQESFIQGDSEKVTELGHLFAKEVLKVSEKGMKDIQADFHASHHFFLLLYDEQNDLTRKKWARNSKQYRRLVRWRKENQSQDGVQLEWNVWNFSKELSFIALSGEVCHEISLRAKKISKTENNFFMGYTNGCPGYIPSDKIVKEGGYEGHDAAYVYGQPHPFKEGIIDHTLDSELKSLYSN